MRERELTGQIMSSYHPEHDFGVADPKNVLRSPHYTLRTLGQHTSPAGPQLLFVNIVLLNSLAVQWLGLRASTAGGPGLIPGQGTKIPQASHTAWPKK